MHTYAYIHIYIYTHLLMIMMMIVMMMMKKLKDKYIMMIIYDYFISIYELTPPDEMVKYLSTHSTPKPHPSFGDLSGSFWDAI